MILVLPFLLDRAESVSFICILGYRFAGKYYIADWVLGHRGVPILLVLSRGRSLPTCPVLLLLL